MKNLRPSAVAALALTILLLAVRPARADAGAAAALDPRDFGAIGDGGSHPITTTDMQRHPTWLGHYHPGDEWDYVGIQEAVYAAFGGPGHEHGSDQPSLNRPIHLAHGRYLVNRPVSLVHLLGGTISGDGRFATAISTRSSDTAFQTNGASMCRFE